jgi:rod shape determining protein RodA
MLRKDFWRHFDFWLFGAVAFLSVFGIIMIQSAVAGNQELAGNAQRQTIYVGIGLVVILVVAVVDYHFWAPLTRLMYIFTAGFLVVIFITAQARFGAARWLDFGFILIQPAELAKIVIILVLSDFFARTRTTAKDLRWIGQSFLLVGFLVVWILLQPNLSTSIVLLVIWFAMIWINGLPTKYLVIFLLVGLVLAGALFPFLEPYQQARILTFIFPDPNARHGNTYNVEQALITIGSGGWFGQGYGHGTQVQLRFLQVRHTDYIFSAMAGEFGFFGTVVIVGLLVFVVLRCRRAAKLAADPLGMNVAYGFAVLIFFQMAVNIGVNLNLIPVTGLTLPFISYGGSSLLSLMLGIGLVESVLAHRSK